MSASVRPSVRPSVCPSVRLSVNNDLISFFRKMKLQGDKVSIPTLPPRPVVLNLLIRWHQPGIVAEEMRRKEVDLISFSGEMREQGDTIGIPKLSHTYVVSNLLMRGR